MNGADNLSEIGNFFNNCPNKLGLSGTETNYSLLNDGTLTLTGQVSQKNYFFATQVNAQSILSGIDTKIKFDTIGKTDGVAQLNNSSDMNVITSGYYMVSCWLRFDDAVTLKNIKISNNGNSNRIAQLTTVNAEVIINFVYQFDANSNFDIYVQHTKGSAINTVTASG